MEDLDFLILRLTIQLQQSRRGIAIKVEKYINDTEKRVQNRLAHIESIDLLTRCNGNLMENGQSFKQMVPEQLDVHMQINI